MNVRELREALEGVDPEMEVEVFTEFYGPRLLTRTVQWHDPGVPRTTLRLRTEPVR